MPKITINGEIFDYELTRQLSEALAIEKAWGRRYAEWESEFLAGSAEAMAVFVWTVWRRDGRDVPLSDILDGKIDFDYLELQASLRAPIEAAEEDPTAGAETSSAPDGTDTTRAATKRSSQRSSTSRRGTSGSSQ